MFSVPVTGRSTKVYIFFYKGVQLLHREVYFQKPRSPRDEYRYFTAHRSQIFAFIAFVIEGDGKSVVKSSRELQLTVLRLFPGILVPGTTWKTQRNMVENRYVLFNWWQASEFSLQYHCLIKHTGYENKLNDHHRLNVLSSSRLEFSTSGKNRIHRLKIREFHIKSEKF